MPIPLLPIAAVSGLALFYKWRKSRNSDTKSDDDSKSPSSSTSAKSGGAGTGSGGGITNLSGFANAGFLGTVGTASLLAGGKVGYFLTGTELGRTVGTVNPVLGNVANAGAVIGGEIDKQFGGTGSGGTGIIAGAGGAAITLTATIIGTFAAVAILPLVAIAYGVASAFSDANELAYGQAGANATLKSRKDEIWKQVYDQVYKAYVGKYDNKLIADFSELYAKAYCRAANRMAYTEWMNKPHGLFASIADHAKYGADRGKFVGDTDSSTGALIETTTANWGEIPGAGPLSGTAGNTVNTQAMQGANKDAFVKHMASPHGFGMNNVNHAKYGIEHGIYAGVIKTDQPNNDNVFLVDNWGKPWWPDGVERIEGTDGYVR